MDARNGTLHSRNSAGRAEGSEQVMIPFIDLGAQRRRLGRRVDDAIVRVLDHGGFIMGPEIRMLEEQLAEFSGSGNAVACSSGTDALLLALMALDLKPGDAVLVPGFSFAAPAEMVALLGGTPIFVDVQADSFIVAADSFEPGLQTARNLGLKLVGAITVDLYGRPADYSQIETEARRLGIWLICDAAQSFGAEYCGKPVGCFGQITTTSFYPAKPLACYGDGGAVFTDDDKLADKVRSLLMHGMGADKYDNIRVGINGRMDSIQAAVLLEKLKIFEDELAERDKVATAYSRGLSNINGVVVPEIPGGIRSSWAQYTLRLELHDQAKFQSRLSKAGIPTAIHYPVPLHRQVGYRRFPSVNGKLPVCDLLSKSVVSLPMHPYINKVTQAQIIDTVAQVVS